VTVCGHHNWEALHIVFYLNPVMELDRNSIEKECSSHLIILEDKLPIPLFSS